MNIGGEAAGQPEVYHTSSASECKYPDFHGYSKVRVGAESVHRIARIERERRQLFVSFAQFDAVSPDVDVAIPDFFHAARCASREEAVGRHC
jgi:hypothetical protein